MAYLSTICLPCVMWSSVSISAPKKALGQNFLFSISI